jgi:hypothetical protein
MGGWVDAILPSIFTLYASPVNSYGREAGGGVGACFCITSFLSFLILHL